MKAAGFRDVVARVEIALCALAAICHSAIADDVEVAVTNTPGHVLINSTSTTLVAGTAHGDGARALADSATSIGWRSSPSASASRTARWPRALRARCACAA